MADRINANNWLGKEDAFLELDALKFSASSLIQQYPKGSHERELAENAVRGIRHRIDYLHDSFRKLLSSS